MSRPKLSSPDQPLLVRWLLRLYEFAASLGLAVVLIFSSALALGLATFVEAAWSRMGNRFEGEHETHSLALGLEWRPPLSGPQSETPDGSLQGATASSPIVVGFGARMTFDASRTAVEAPTWLFHVRTPLFVEWP